jgi:hypothetical protein
MQFLAFDCVSIIGPIICRFYNNYQFFKDNMSEPLREN